MSAGNGQDKGITLHSNGSDFAIETSPGRFVAEIDPATMQPNGRAKRFVIAPDVLAPTADLSSAERSERMDMAIAQVAALTRQVGVLTHRIDVVERHIKRHEPVALGRLDALERVTAQRWALPFMARLRWFLIGR